MTNIIYINEHPSYDYSSAMVQGFSYELGDYVRETEWVIWSSPRQIMVCGKDEHPERLRKFVEYVLREFVVNIRPYRWSDGWTPIDNLEDFDQYMEKNGKESAQG